MLSPHFTLSVKTRIIFKSLNEVCKQTIFRNVKRDNGCRENTATVTQRAYLTQINWNQLSELLVFWEREKLEKTSWSRVKNQQTQPTCDAEFGNRTRVTFTLVTRRPYCPGRPKELCFTAPSLAVETMGARLGVVKQSFFGLPGQYDRRVTRAN